jgi:hypothetical protein
MSTLPWSTESGTPTFLVFVCAVATVVLAFAVIFADVCLHDVACCRYKGREWRRVRTDSDSETETSSGGEE